MRTEQGNMLQSLRAVEAFLDTNAAKLGGVVKTGTRQQLSDAIAELSKHASEQTGNRIAAQGATLNQRALRRVLVRDHLRPVSRIGRANLPHTPQLQPLRMPLPKVTTEKLAAAASGMAKAAAPFADTFIQAGLPIDFIAQLNDATAAMVKTLSDRSQNRGNRRGATKGLKAKLIDGRKIVRILDAFVQTALKDDPALLANWNTVKRVQLVTGRPAGTSASAAPAPTAGPAPTPAPTPTLATK